MGLTLAAIGVTLVVWRKLEAGFGTMEGVLLCVLALCGITAATLYQKRFCGAMDLRSGSVIQYTAAGLAAGLGSFLFEAQRIRAEERRVGKECDCRGIYRWARDNKK